MPTTIFTSRWGGVSCESFSSLNLGQHVGDSPEDVTGNRAQLACLLSIAPRQLYFMTQVHGSNVLFIDGDSDSRISPTADALVTSTQGVALVVLVADCIPVLMSAGTVVAAVHVGRAGLMHGILMQVVSAIRELTDAQIEAEFGPSICGECYQVSEEIYADVVSRFPEAGRDSAQRLLDLPAAAEAQLHTFGASVRRSTVCTKESEDHFSYRRDGRTGRQAGVILL